MLDRSTLRREFGLSETSTVVTFLGRLIAAKQAELLIDTVQLLRERDGCDVELLVVGTGPEEGNIRARLREDRERPAWVPDNRIATIRITYDGLSIAEPVHQRDE